MNGIDLKLIKSVEILDRRSRGRVSIRKSRRGWRTEDWIVVSGSRERVVGVNVNGSNWGVGDLNRLRFLNGCRRLRISGSNAVRR